MAELPSNLVNTMLRRQAIPCLAIYVALSLFAPSIVRAELPYQIDWGHQIGTDGHNLSHDISVDSHGNLFVAATVSGSQAGPYAGEYDVLVSKYDLEGNLDWSRQFGTASNELGYGISADGLGNVYIAGDTNGSLGAPNAGGNDAFVSKYDGDGNQKWTKQIGTEVTDTAWAVSADQLGNVFITGTTSVPTLLE